MCYYFIVARYNKNFKYSVGPHDEGIQNREALLQGSQL